MDMWLPHQKKPQGKAETLEDLNEWKDALEDALAQAPNVALVMGHNSIFRNEPTDGIDVRSKHPVKSLVVGRPILLALEDVNGAPSFLEKALRFLEQYGVKVEGIFRQSASVDDVARRVREYEQGNNEFSPDEDPHVVADCIKHVLRELPSSLVPASCCSALLKACRTERGVRVNAIRRALYETFPEPNCRLLKRYSLASTFALACLQHEVLFLTSCVGLFGFHLLGFHVLICLFLPSESRILLVMQAVASHKSENRMSLSAVAACMAPLILRPLVAGNCEIENGFDLSGNGSLQLLKAAAAANHAQAIVITLLEEFCSIFECKRNETAYDNVGMKLILDVLAVV
ncbi:Rho GTPase-activating protein REN1 [Vitis vinifera]|uniref:Rho GTPase-activating protein REN1 n=1 Tax=Vitis vinifera TaxID=29760 RepID=A0A438KRQ8_VITVI|nr:Rho GTPase-activating protein REN1 [Vitis vinifera]